MISMDEIITDYRKTDSIEGTAANYKIAPQKVRRILITAGVYSNETSQAVVELLQKGMQVDEIARHLKISKSAVNSYMPYSKGMYKTVTPTDNALRIRKCREKMLPV